MGDGLWVLDARMLGGYDAGKILSSLADKSVS